MLLPDAGWHSYLGSPKNGCPFVNFLKGIKRGAPISPPHHRRASALSISCSTGFSFQSGDTPAPARHSFSRGVYSAIPATSLPSVIERESAMGSNVDNPSGVPCSTFLSLPKSSPCKTMPLVFMTRGEGEARSSKFYPGALPMGGPQAPSDRAVPPGPTTGKMTVRLAPATLTG